MSELVNARRNRKDVRWQLLATASAIALIGFSYETNAARADDDSDHPQLWIELGGQLSGLNDGQEAFAPAFPDSPPRPSILAPSQKFERLPLYSVDETGKISFQPDGSDWVLSASVRYGRSSSDKHVRQQTHPNPHKKYYTSFGVSQTNTATPGAAKFADTNAQTSEHHLIVDFQAGKDVGLGMFGGRNGSSILNLGVRFAQFGNKSHISLKSNPDWHFSYKYTTGPVKSFLHTSKIVRGSIYHSNAASLQASRSFQGVGPSISWNASAPFAGNTKNGELTFDWGVNAAFLFGRQRAKVHHQATGQYHGAKYAQAARVTVYDPPPVDRDRAKTVTVPNVGGFAGLSFQIQNFKVSAGYRADLFFNAMDGGIDTRKSENVGFYGPFAAVSVGIGG